jgi:hypothetical protein
LIVGALVVGYPDLALAKECSAIKDATVRLGCYDQEHTIRTDAQPRTKKTTGENTPNNRKTRLITLTHEQLVRARDARRKSLKDPEAARFSGEKAVEQIDPPGDVLVCGWMNAKNSFGGYVGRQIYYAIVQRDGKTDQTDALTTLEDLVRTPSFYKGTCAKLGILPDD